MTQFIVFDNQEYEDVVRAFYNTEIYSDDVLNIAFNSDSEGTPGIYPKMYPAVVNFIVNYSYCEDVSKTNIDVSFTYYENIYSGYEYIDQITTLDKLVDDLYYEESQPLQDLKKIEDLQSKISFLEKDLF